jgi:pimeloyl-ACP methyl ester carboxylesterase
LVHGIASSSDTWGQFFDHWNEVLNCGDHPELARPGRLIIAPDLPGYGRSETDHVFNMVELASWLAKLLDELQVDKVHFVGNSMGCQVGLAFARMFPERIRSLNILISCSA